MDPDTHRMPWNIWDAYESWTTISFWKTDTDAWAEYYVPRASMADDGDINLPPPCRTGQTTDVVWMRTSEVPPPRRSNSRPSNRFFNGPTLGDVREMEARPSRTSIHSSYDVPQVPSAEPPPPPPAPPPPGTSTTRAGDVPLIPSGANPLPTPPVQTTTSTTTTPADAPAEVPSHAPAGAPAGAHKCPRCGFADLVCASCNCLVCVPDAPAADAQNNPQTYITVPNAPVAAAPTPGSTRSVRNKIRAQSVPCSCRLSIVNV